MKPKEDENGLDTSGSPSDNEDGSATAASPTDDREDGSSPKEEDTQTSLEAVTDALNVDVDSEGGEDEEGKKKVESEEEKKESSDEDGKADGEKDKAKTDDLSEEELSKPLPDDTPVKTAERFNKLTDGYKALSEKHETLTTESEGLKKYHSDFSSLLEHSGATPEEFNDLIDYSHKVKSGDLEGALAVLDMQRAGLAKALGKPLPGIDLFKDHPDLQEQIDSHELTENNAGEIVKSRNAEALRIKQEKVDLEQQDVTNAKQQSDEKLNEQIVTAEQDIMNLVNGWEKNDINFSAKQASIVSKVEEIGQKFRPERWAEILQLHYDAIKVEIKPRGGNQQNPLRNGGKGGGGKKEATTSLGALENVLGAGT